MIHYQISQQQIVSSLNLRENFILKDNSLFYSGLRLLNIGRNEYIELMNQARSNKGKLFGKTNVRYLLPKVPCNIYIEPWWRVEVGLVLEEDIKVRQITLIILPKALSKWV